jgi:ABC-type uncharacterized transport system auxiliary subunit
MRRVTASSLRAPLLIGLAALASACAAGPAPRDHFYRLRVETPQSSRTSPVFPGTLEVDRLRGDALTRGRSILRRESEQDVEVIPYAYHLWVDSPTLLLQRQLANYLRGTGLAERVVRPEMNVSEDWIVTGYLARLDHVVGESPARVVVELELTLAEVKRSALLLSHSYREERAIQEPGVPAAVRAFDAAVTSIFERFVADAAAAR